MRINRVGVFAAAFGLLLGLSGPVGSSVTQAEPESYIICTQGTADEGKDPIDHPIAAPWGPAAQALEPGDPLPEPDTDPDNIIEPPITNGMIVEGRGAGEGTTYKITIDPTCGLSLITPAPTAPPKPYIICTQGTADEGKDPIDHPIAAPWGPAAQALEPGDPLPEPDTDPDNIIEPPITNGMIVEGRGAGEGTTYKITIDPTCGLSPVTPAPPSSPAEPAPSETAPPSGPAPSVLKPSFTG